MIRDVLKKTTSSTLFMTLLIFVVGYAVISNFSLAYAEECCCEGTITEIDCCGTRIIWKPDNPIYECWDRDVDEGCFTEEEYLGHLCWTMDWRCYSGELIIGSINCDFTSTTTTTNTFLPPCLTEEILEYNDPRLDVLRYFRDYVLSQTPEGQEIISIYYEWSPAIVKAMEEDEEFKEDVKEMIDGILGVVAEGVE